MTAERLKKLRELRAAADQGEWQPGRMDTESYDGNGNGPYKNIYTDVEVVARGQGSLCRPNAALIAAVVNDLDELLTAAEEAGRLQQDAGNLLAVIHGDGGHYIANYGWKQACLDAAEIVIKRWADNERLREALQKYGRHSDTCEQKQATAKANAGSNVLCSCGLDAALEGKA